MSANGVWLIPLSCPWVVLRIQIACIIGIAVSDKTIVIAVPQTEDQIEGQRTLQVRKYLLRSSELFDRGLCVNLQR